MSPGALGWTIAAKETRALLPAWIACVAAAIAATLTADGTREVSLLALGAATVGLGAQSIGHEYAHGTLALMLTLPVDRRRLFLVKFAVLGAMLLPLGGSVWLLGLVANVPALLWLTVGVSMCLAPSLTMLCRSQIAGLIFSMSLPGMLITAVMIVTGTLWGGSEETERAALATWSQLMLPVLAGGAVVGWRLFMRLESIEGGASEIHLKWWTRTPSAVAPRHPLWQLVKKELRLQQLTFAMTALFLVASWPGAVLFRFAGLDDDASFIGAGIYWLAVPALVGSLATAGERQLGTLAWQLQLPTPAWHQWAAKVGIVFSLALVLAVGVPAPIAYVFWPTERVVTELTVVLVIVVTAASLYMSSLCATGLRAAMASFAAIPIALWLVVRFALASGTRAEPDFWSGQEGAWLALVSLVVVLLVGLAFVNHRPEQPTPARIWRQALSIAVLVAFGLVLLDTAHF